MNTPLPTVDRTRIRRIAERGHYDRDTIHRVIDAAWHCHIAFLSNGSSHCIPTACWREGEHLYIHGSNGSRLLKTLAEGADACVCITHLDGLVLARSAFHHSMNYRSVCIYGHFDKTCEEDKALHLDVFMRRFAPGREREVRAPDPTELAATTILRISTAEAVAKIREAGPKDDEADLALPVWNGILPLRVQHLDAIASADCQVAAPDYARQWANSVD